MSVDVFSISVLLKRKMMKDIIQECSLLRETVQAINDEAHGPLLKMDHKNTQFPYVLL